MTPTFALTLDSDGIALLKRNETGDGWLLVGSVGLEDPDLGTRLMELRAQGEVLAGDLPFATKLVLPDAQVLYTETVVRVPHATDGANRAAQQLDGRTPYALEDLAYDWAWVGDTLRIAAVARETLEEAEDFASLHRFNPIAFVAVPPEGGFPGEPFFGPSGQAAQWLPPGEIPSRDTAPVHVVGEVVDEVRPAPPEVPQAAAEELPSTVPDGAAAAPDLPGDETEGEAAPETVSATGHQAATEMPAPDAAPEPPVAPAPAPRTAAAETFPVAFGQDGYDLAGMDETAAAAVATGAKGCRGRVVVTGHTDDRGTDDVNDLIGLARAESVQRWLAKQGVPSARIDIRSAGSTDPAASNATEEGRSANRRVTITCFPQ